MGAGLIAAGAAVGNAFNSLFNIGAARKQYHRQKALMTKQFNMDKEMWNIQNEYNLPENQMARLKAAGLNPNLVYGSSGGISGNTVSNIPKTQSFGVQREQLQLPDTLAMMNQYQDLKIKGAQEDAIRANTLNTETTQALNFAKKIKAEYEAAIKYGAPYDADVRALGGQLIKTQASIAKEQLRMAQYNSQIRARDSKYYWLNKSIPAVGSALKGFMPMFRKAPIGKQYNINP